MLINNRSLVFNGDDTYVDLPSEKISLGNDFAFSCLIKCRKDANDQSGLFSLDGNNKVAFYSNTTFGSANNGIRLWSDDTGEILVGPDIRDNKWHEIKLIREGNTFSLYVDGDLESTGNATFDIDDGVLDLGRIVWNPDRNFKGLLNEVKIDQDNLNLHYPLDEGEGNIAYDLAGGNDATIHNGSWTDDAFVEHIGTNVLSFDGIDDFIDSNYQHSTGQGTLEFWLYSYDNSEFGTGYHNSDSSRLYIRHDIPIGLGDDFVRDNFKPQENKWHHIALVFEDGVGKLYLNFVEISTLNYNWSGTTGNLFIGARNFDSNDYWNANCLISEFRIWDYARNISDLESFAETRLTGNEEGLVGYYPLDEGEGDIAYNKSTNGDDGVINGGQWITLPSVGLPTITSTGYMNNVSGEVTIEEINNRTITGYMNNVSGEVTITEINNRTITGYMNNVSGEVTITEIYRETIDPTSLTTVELNLTKKKDNKTVAIKKNRKVDVQQRNNNIIAIIKIQKGVKSKWK